MRGKIYKETDETPKAELQAQLDQGTDNPELARRLSEWADSQS
jgi:hypothetical protein